MQDQGPAKLEQARPRKPGTHLRVRECGILLNKSSYIRTNFTIKFVILDKKNLRGGNLEGLWVFKAPPFGSGELWIRISISERYEQTSQHHSGQSGACRCHCS